MGFKVKGTPKRNNFEVENSINEAENKLRLDILNQLSAFDIKTLQIAYVYAKNYAEYGIDVTEKWVTVCENSVNLEKAHHKGYCEGYEKAKQDYCDKWRMKNVFGDGEVIPDSKACTDEKKEPENPIYQFEIGQIVKKVNGYPNPSTFKVLDRFVINLTHPYYKIGLIDKFFDKDNQETVPNHYQYVPENRLKLPDEDDISSNTFKFHVGDIVKFRPMNYGLFKVAARYADPNVNTYKIDDMHDGWSIVVYEHQLELVSKRIIK